MSFSHQIPVCGISYIKPWYGENWKGCCMGLKISKCWWEHKSDMIWYSIHLILIFWKFHSYNLYFSTSLRPSNRGKKLWCLSRMEFQIPIVLNQTALTTTFQKIILVMEVLEGPLALCKSKEAPLSTYRNNWISFFFSEPHFRPWHFWRDKFSLHHLTNS